MWLATDSDIRIINKGKLCPWRLKEINGVELITV